MQSNYHQKGDSWLLMQQILFIGWNDFLHKYSNSHNEKQAVKKNSVMFTLYSRNKCFKIRFFIKSILFLLLSFIIYGQNTKDWVIIDIGDTTWLMA